MNIKNKKVFVRPIDADMFFEEIRTKGGDSFCLFIGSGLSQSYGLPGWEALLTKMLENKYFSKDEIIEIKEMIAQRDFLIAGQICKQRLLEARKLREFLLKTLRNVSKQPSVDIMKLVVDTKIKKIITTNFDNLLEDAFVREKKQRTVYSWTDLKGINLVSPDPIILKIHGCLSLNIGDISKIILGIEDYYELSRNNVYREIMRGLFLQNSHIFLGYSLSDPEIREFMNFYAQLFEKHSGLSHFIFTQDDRPLYETVITNLCNVRFIKISPDIDINYAMGQILKEIKKAVAGHLPPPIAQLQFILPKEEIIPSKEDNPLANVSIVYACQMKATEGGHKAALIINSAVHTIRMGEIHGVSSLKGYSNLLSPEISRLYELEQRLQEITNSTHLFILDKSDENPFVWFVLNKLFFLSPYNFVKVEKIRDGEEYGIFSENSCCLADNYHDFGMLAKYPSPFNESHFIFVIAGVHRNATSAGSYLCTNTKLLNEIDKKLTRGINETNAFQVIFKVPRKNMQIAPTVEILNIAELDDKVIHNALDIDKETYLLSKETIEWIVEEKWKRPPENFFSGCLIPLQIVHLDITMDCPWDCKYCIERPSKQKAKGLKFSLEDIESLFGQFRDIGVHDLQFYGGEPTYHEDFAKIFEMTINYPFRLKIVTNGYGLAHPDRASEIIKSISKVSLVGRTVECRVSIDAATPYTHALVHNYKDWNHFDKIFEAMKKLADSKVTVSGSFLLQQDNYSELKDCCKRVAETNAAYFCIRPMTKEQGENLIFPLDENLRKSIYEEIVSLKEKNSSKDSMKIIIPFWFEEYLKDGVILKRNVKESKCYSAYARIVISPPAPGHVSLCAYNRYHPRFSGSLEGATLKDWLNENAIKMINNFDPQIQCSKVICNRTGIDRDLHNLAEKRKSMLKILNGS